MQEVIHYYHATYPCLWLTTQEPHRAEREISVLFLKAGVPAFRWDVQSGGPVPLQEKDGFISSVSDPVEVLDAFTGMEGPGVLFLWNYHHFTESPEVQQAILNSIPALQAGAKMLIILAPAVSIPPEIEKVVTVVDFRLPTEDDLGRYLDEFCEARKVSLSDEEKRAITKAGLGLTRVEFMSALALSQIKREGRIVPADVWEQKAQLVRKNDVLEMFKPSEEDRFDMIGGLENLKAFLKATAEHSLARGVLLLGVPGTGKSAVAKALGTEIGLPVLSLDFGRAFGSLVGESEARIRRALRVVDAMSPCVLFIDEIEKGLSGVASSHQTDGGVGARVFGTFLQWLNDRRSQVYVIATCNDISKLPPEFLRAERWDAIFFVDVPTAEERKQIWRIWQARYGLAEDAPRPKDEGWTGAEIRTCCRLAAVMGTTPAEAARFVVPVAQSMGEKIAQLREWAKNRCVPASKVEVKNPPKAKVGLSFC